MLLLLTPALPTRRGARPAGALLHRSGAAAPHRSHHAGVHVLRRVLARCPSTLGTLMGKAHAPNSSHYYIPHDSPWPIRGSIALFAIMLGAIGYLNDWSGAWSFLPGAALLAYMFFGWFSTVIGENQHGVYNLQVDRSFRMGMMWFIFSEAYRELGLRLSTGIYGSTFFMLTGFHGLHVTLGAIMLTVIWLRVLRGHFSADRHFAFEAVAWYWHFVDWVWLALFIFVYWL